MEVPLYKQALDYYLLLPTTSTIAKNCLLSKIRVFNKRYSYACVGVRS